MKKFLTIFLSLFIASSAFAQTTKSSNHIWESAAYGQIPGVTEVVLNGNNGAITTTYEAVWPESSAYTPLNAAMSTPYCASSDNTNDKAAGTGCLTMQVQGVNTSYAAFTETVTMNGQTSVNLATSNVLFINNLKCLTTGSTFANTGTIRCGTGTNTAGVPAVVHAHMPIGFGKSQTAMYLVPASRSLICRNWNFASAGLGANLAVKFAIGTYTDPVSARNLQRDEVAILNQSAGHALTLPYLVKYPAKTLVMVQALAATSTGPVNVSAECLLVNDTWAATGQNVF